MAVKLLHHVFSPEHVLNFPNAETFGEIGLSFNMPYRDVFHCRLHRSHYMRLNPYIKVNS